MHVFFGRTFKCVWIFRVCMDGWVGCPRAAQYRHAFVEVTSYDQRWLRGWQVYDQIGRVTTKLSLDHHTNESVLYMVQAIAFNAEESRFELSWTRQDSDCVHVDVYPVRTATSPAFADHDFDAPPTAPWRQILYIIVSTVCDWAKVKWSAAMCSNLLT